jgi:ubiquinone/menaquinone biosynthesis C-methylase UbiE
VRRRLRPVLPRLHLLPALNERPGDTVVAIGAVDTVGALADRVAPDGDVLLVDESPDVLERARHATAAPNVFYLLGSLDVLPLVDVSVDEVLATGVLRADGARECFRVLQSGGRLSLTAVDEDPAVDALNLDPHEVEHLLTDSGFASVSVAADGGRLLVRARKP